MTTPVALAEVAPRYAELAPTAYAQIATAVIITAIMAPILTGWVDKKFCHGKEDLSPAGVEAIEEAVATDIDDASQSSRRVQFAPCGRPNGGCSAVTFGRSAMIPFTPAEKGVFGSWARLGRFWPLGY